MIQPLDPTGIDTIIVDLGNVIIDIDYDTMVAEFGKIASRDFSEIVSYTQQDNVFNLFEKGQISVPDFRSALRKYLHDHITDEQIDAAWNAILHKYPAEKFDLLKRLRGKYKIYALSNINQIHLDDIDRYVAPFFGVADMRSYFDHAYYSHEMGLRKPEPEIYQAVIDHGGIDPAHTLFIDDKAENTAAAEALGFRVHQLRERDSLVELMRLF